MYNNDPKYMNPQQGLASLVNSPYGDSDVMQVKMTPREVAGLQQLALNYGANEQDLYDPVTGQPRFNFLKKLLPMVIGAVLPGVPGIGKIASTIGFGNAAVGSALLVGGTTALIEGDLKKGLMAGLGAYSGANLAQSFQAAAAAPVTTPEEVVKTGQAVDAAARTVGAPGSEISAFDVPDNIPGLAGTSMAPPSYESMVKQFPKDFPVSVNEGSELLARTTTPADFLPRFGQTGIIEGTKSLFTNPNARTAFGQALGGGFQSPFAQNLSRYATFAGAADAFTPEVEMPSGYDLDDTVYIPGELNPNYGLGQQYGKFLPGQYYKRTKKGLVPYNPHQLAPGYATGGLAGVAPGAGGRGDPAMVAINAPYTEADARKRYEQMVYGAAPTPRNVQPVMDYITDLNRRAKNPPIYAYPPGGIVGGGTTPGGGRGTTPGGGGPTGPGDKNEPGGGLGGAGPIAGGGGMPGGGIGGGIPGGGMGTGVGEGGGRGGGSGLPPGYQTGIGAGGSNYYDTFDPNIVESFPVKPDPDTPALVDEALGENKAIKFVRKALGLDDPIGLGLGLVNPAAGLVWKMLPATTQQKVRNFVSGVFNLDDTPIVEAELEQEIKDAAEKEKSRQAETSVDRDRVSTRGKEGSTAGRGYSPSPFGPSTGGIGGLMGRRGVISIDENIRQSAKGGRIKAMQTGGMTAPNPYGAAVGEDFNFGFSGGGQTEYAAAGKLLEGEGDGMSDDIPAVIRGKGVQRAALADGEFVVPADVVSHLGNGSTKAGAKKLYAMMDRVRQARTGRTRQAPAVKTDRLLPA